MSDEPNRKHLGFWAKVPDAIDDAHKEADSIHKSLLNKAILQYKAAGGYLSAAWNGPSQSRVDNTINAYNSFVKGAMYAGASTTVSAFNAYIKMNFHTEAFDLLRLGDSLLNPSAENIVKDVLRVLNLLPLVGRAGALVKEGMLVTQEAGTMKCLLVSLNNILAETGQGFLRGGKFFVNIREVAKARGLLAKIEELGANAQDLIKLKAALTEIGVVVEEIPRPLEHVEVGIRVLEDIARANPKGALVIAIRFGEILPSASGEARSLGHVLTGQFIPGKGIVFTDTGGQVLEGVSELLRVFPNAVLSKELPTLFLKNTWLVQTFKSPILNIWFPAANWGLTKQQSLSDKQSFIGPPRGTAVADRGPLGMG